MQLPLLFLHILYIVGDYYPQYPSPRLGMKHWQCSTKVNKKLPPPKAGVEFA